jgi:hypothetical protein
MNLKDKKSLLLFYFIAISLLIHLIFSLLFLEFGFKSRVKSLIKSLSQSLNLSDQERKEIEKRKQVKREALQKIFESVGKKPKNSLWEKPKDTRSAKLVAPKSKFGWVIFDDSYKQPDKLEIPTTKNGDLIKVESPNFVNSEKVDKEVLVDVKKVFEDKKTNLTDKPKKQVSKLKQKKRKQDLTPITLPKYAQKSTNNIDKIVAENKISFNTKKDIEKSKKAEERIDDEIEKINGQNINSTGEKQQVDTNTHDILADQRQNVLVNKEEKKEDERESILRAILKKKDNNSYKISKEKGEGRPFLWGSAKSKIEKVSPVSQTRGFVEKLIGEDGFDLVDTLGGDPNVRPKVKDLKYIEYDAKLVKCFQATWKYNSDFYRLPCKAGIYSVLMKFEINCAGCLVCSKIVWSSGNEDMDKAAIKNLRFAAPFPPLPKSFNTNVYKTSFYWQLILS